MRLVFLDKDNTIFSQMAEGLAKRYNKLDDLEICSCGEKKGKKLNKDMIDTMKEIGIDLKNNKINSIKDFKQIDILITLDSEINKLIMPKRAKLSFNSSVYKDDLEKSRDILKKDIIKLLNDIKKGKYN
ncbi:MAG: hypothetical protein ACQEQE_01270 [Bacillota bacterium]